METQQPQQPINPLPPKNLGASASAVAAARRQQAIKKLLQLKNEIQSAGACYQKRDKPYLTFLDPAGVEKEGIDGYKLKHLIVSGGFKDVLIVEIPEEARDLFRHWEQVSIVFSRGPQRLKIVEPGKLQKLFPPTQRKQLPSSPDGGAPQTSDDQLERQERNSRSSQKLAIQQLNQVKSETGSRASPDRPTTVLLLDSSGSAIANDLDTSFEVKYQKECEKMYLEMQVYDTLRKKYTADFTLKATLPLPNLPEVFDLNYDRRTNEVTAIMEAFKGKNLQSLYHEKYSQNNKAPFSQDETVRILLPIAMVLELAHKRGVSHHDIKADNINVATQLGEITQLFDFGISTEVFKTFTVYSLAMTIVGTLDLLAPELWDANRKRLIGHHEPVTNSEGKIIAQHYYLKPRQEWGSIQSFFPKADTYMLGELAFRLLSGQNLCDVLANVYQLPTAYQNPCEMQLLHQQGIKEEMIPLFKEKMGMADEQLKEIILQAMAVDPEVRPGLDKIKATLLQCSSIGSFVAQLSKTYTDRSRTRNIGKEERELFDGLTDFLAKYVPYSLELNDSNLMTALRYFNKIEDVKRLLELYEYFFLAKNQSSPTNSKVPSNKMGKKNGAQAPSESGGILGQITSWFGGKKKGSG